MCPVASDYPEGRGFESQQVPEVFNFSLSSLTIEHALLSSSNLSAVLIMTHFQTQEAFLMF